MFRIQRTPYGGRGAFASQAIPEDTLIHTCPGPFAHLVYRAFRKEICAYCFVYAFDSGKSGWGVKIACDGDGSAKGGVWFCKEECRDRWEEEDNVDGMLMSAYDAIDREAKRLGKANEKGKGKDDGKPRSKIQELEKTIPKKGEAITQDLIDQAWKSAEAIAESRNHGEDMVAELHKSDVDVARFISTVLVHRYIEDNHPTPPPSPSTSPSTSKSPSPTPSLQSFSQSLPSSPPTSPSPSLKSFLPLPSPELSGNDWLAFLNLQNNELAHLQSIPAALCQALRVYLFTLQTLPPPLLQYLPGPGSDDPLIKYLPLSVRELQARDAGNSFGIWQQPSGGESEMFGWGIWVSASFFNHSCDPNVHKVRNGRIFEFYTSSDVEEGEELCISYGFIDDDLDVKERREGLKESWYFECECSRCLEEMREKENNRVAVQD
ncbi:hypothetical protein JAAARDRAFT_197024 [Jaapia argillacea MUCL 33604]|uniref:SET domain-containing protein n=1 Tax=Jaapia argillacea MUCL 33604 TaxID=933084 RepID=A0A067PRI5_9AGAM|nr:hypothetical protein JAAARDRAFT_197024 [Jaapia argillacea MUCL 33604]